MANTTPIIRISQLPVETDKTMSGNPANTWFAIVNADVMKTRRLSLEDLLKFLANYFDSPLPASYIKFQTEGGLKANGASLAQANLGEVLVISDTITFDHANSAFLTSNLAFNHANGAFLKTNLSFAHANSAYTHANGAFDKANSEIVLFSNGGLSLVSSNPDNTKLSLGQNLYVSAPPISITTTNGLTIDGNLNKATSLGQSFTLSANPITVNTLNGITGGKQLKLGETINLDGAFIYNHSNSSYNRANASMINPPINYVTSAQNNLVTIANNRYVIVGDENSNIHVKLPAGVPVVNSYIYFTNMSSSKNNTIQYNGTRIHGLGPNEHLRLDVWNVSIIMCYTDPTRGWVLV